MAVFFLRKGFCAIFVERDHIRYCFILIFFWHEGCSLQYEKSHRLHDRRDAPGKLTAQGKAGEYNEDWNDDHPLGG